MKLVVFKSLGKSDTITFGFRTVISARSSTRARAADVLTFSPLKRASAYMVCVMINIYQSPKSLNYLHQFLSFCMSCISYIISQLHEWSTVTVWDISLSPCRIFITLTACISCEIISFQIALILYDINRCKASWYFIMASLQKRKSTQNIMYAQNMYIIHSPYTFIDLSMPNLPSLPLWWESLKQILKSTW